MRVGSSKLILLMVQAPPLQHKLQEAPLQTKVHQTKFNLWIAMKGKMNKQKTFSPNKLFMPLEWSGKNFELSWKLQLLFEKIFLRWIFYSIFVFRCSSLKFDLPLNEKLRRSKCLFLRVPMKAHNMLPFSRRRAVKHHVEKSTLQC